MSTLSNLSNYGTDYQIGEIINVLVGDTGSEAATLLASSGFIKCNQIYNQIDYPKLYAKIGLVQSGYDTATQFYIPDYTLTTPLTLSGWTAPRTAAKWITYIKAK